MTRTIPTTFCVFARGAPFFPLVGPRGRMHVLPPYASQVPAVRMRNLAPARPNVVAGVQVAGPLFPTRLRGPHSLLAFHASTVGKLTYIDMHAADPCLLGTGQLSLII